MVDLVPFEKYMTSVRSEATAGRYVRSVEAFLVWVGTTYGAVALGKLEPVAVKRYTVYLLDSGYLPTTIYSHLAGVKRYFRWLREQGVSVPDFYRVELPKRKRRVKDTLSGDLLRHYLRVAGELTEPLRTAAQLLPCSGLRSNEMVSLRLSDVHKSMVRLTDGTEKQVLVFTVRGKGGHERSVPLFDEGSELLLSYLRGWRRSHSDQMYLFPGRYSGHLSTRALRDSVQRIRGAFRARWTPHTMRRTYLTTLYRRGVPLPTLAKIGGHTVQVLVDYYLGVDDHDAVAALHTTGSQLVTGGYRQ